MTDSVRQVDCPYCGEPLDGQPISDHVRHAHYRDDDGEFRCPGVVAIRRELGLPDEGHGANLRNRIADTRSRNDRGQFSRGGV